MITLTNEQIEKIDLLDKLFGAFDSKQLKDFTETEEVVAKLKGTNANPGILKRIIQEHDIMMSQMSTVQNDLMMLRADMQTLIKAVDKPYDMGYQNLFQNLKSRHSIY